MTREEAKTRITAMKAKFEMLLSMQGREMSDVFDVAIEALSTEPCEDTISRADTIEWLKKVTVTDGITFETGFKQILTDIRNMPPVTPKQKMGRWEMCEDSDGIYGVCSECGQDTDFSHYGKAYPYCPNCGAKMAESEE